MSLEALTHLIEQHGASLFFALGFAEFIGIPVASVPALILGGALAGLAEGANPVLMVVAASAGGWVADASLFTVARWKGPAMVDAACGLTSSPNACVLKTTERVRRTGPAFIYWAKFVPGVANLIAPAAALGGVGAVRFLSRDLLALLVWAAVYTTVGWIFASQAEPLLQLTGRYLRLVIPVALALVGAATIWRLWRVRLHRRLHRRAEGARVASRSLGAVPGATNGTWAEVSHRRH